MQAQKRKFLQESQEEEMVSRTSAFETTQILNAGSAFITRRNLSVCMGKHRAKQTLLLFNTSKNGSKMR